MVDNKNLVTEQGQKVRYYYVFNYSNQLKEYKKKKS